MSPATQPWESAAELAKLFGKAAQSGLTCATRAPQSVSDSPYESCIRHQGHWGSHRNFSGELTWTGDADQHKAIDVEKGQVWTALEYAEAGFSVTVLESRREYVECLAIRPGRGETPTVIRVNPARFTAAERKLTFVGTTDVPPVALAPKGAAAATATFGDRALTYPEICSFREALVKATGLDREAEKDSLSKLIDLGLVSAFGAVGIRVDLFDSRVAEKLNSECDRLAPVAHELFDDLALSLGNM